MELLQNEKPGGTSESTIGANRTQPQTVTNAPGVHGARNAGPKVAWLSPFPPQRSGIANYSQRLVRALKSRLRIDLYYDGQKPAADLANEFPIYSISRFAEQRPNYDEVIYHLGNNSDFHKRIYEMAWQFPGTVVLHDYNLSAFMHEAFFKTGSPLYAAALTEGYVAHGRAEFQRVTRRRAPEPSRFPMSHAIVQRSPRVIVHHRWLRDQFPQQRHIEVIPHFAELNHQPTTHDLENFRERFAINPDHFLLVCAGFINNNKLPNLQIRVAERLVAAGYPVQLLLAGEVAPDVRLAMDSVQTKVIVTGYLAEKDYFSAIAAADVILNLRNPSMGEASGTLMHALAMGRPIIVSDSNQYKEFPDKTCWKLIHDDSEEELLFEYLRTLLANPNVRETLSRNALAFARNVLSLEIVSDRWAALLDNSRGRAANRI